MRKPLKIESLNKIKALGVPIQSVIDVGVLTGTHELMIAFGDKKHILVEPIVEWNDKIRSAYSKREIDFTLINAAASNVEGTMNMEVTTVRPGQPISHARLTSNTDGANIRTVPVRTIDSLMQELSVEPPYIIKIDVDGVELLIMDGARRAFEKTNVVVVEANIKNFIERGSFLQSVGFELFDIVDLCYYDDRLRQFDLIFLNLKTVSDLKLDMYKQKFDMTKWHSYR